VAVTVRTNYTLSLTDTPPPPSGGAAAFSASNQRYTRATFGLDGTTDITVTAWAKIAVDRDTYSFVVSVDNAGANYIQIGPGSSGVNLGVGGTTGGLNAGYDMPVGTWVFIALVWTSAANNDSIMYAEAPSTAVTINTAGVTGWNASSTLYVGGGGFGDWFNGSIAAVKIWQAALSEAEIETELLYYDAQRTSNLYAAYSFRDGPQTNDESGNSRTLTAGGGSPALDSSGPPIT